MGLRVNFLTELRQNLSAKGILAITKQSNPPGGEVIKIKGIALYKILRTSNPFGNQGIAVHRNLDESIISSIGGKRSKGKNGWVAAPLNNYNYTETMRALMEIAERVNASRSLSMTMARRARSKKRRSSSPLSKATQPIDRDWFPKTKPPPKPEPMPDPETVPKKKSTKNLRKKKPVEESTSNDHYDDRYDDVPF